MARGGYSYVAASNRIASAAGNSYQYNADGTPSTNLVPLQYNLYGQLSQYSGTNTRSLNNYNALGQRDLNRVSQYVACSPGGGVPNAARAVGSAAAAPAATCTNWPTVHIVRYVYDEQGRLVGEYDSITGYSQETVWFNNQPVATLINGVLYYVSADNIGAPRSLVRASDNVEIWRWDSDPFGATGPTSPNPGAGTVAYNLRFPGQVTIAGTVYYQNGTRDYAPLTGRYLQPDPSGLHGGLSRYAYASGNPVSYTDPLGLWPFAMPGQGNARAQLPAVLQRLVPALTSTEANQISNDSISQLTWSDVDAIKSVTPNVMSTPTPTSMNDLSSAQQSLLKEFLGTLPRSDKPGVDKIIAACKK